MLLNTFISVLNAFMERLKQFIIILIQMAMLLELMLSLLRKHLKEWAIRPDSYILTGRIRRIFLLTEQLIVHGEAFAWMAGRMNTDGQDLI